MINKSQLDHYHPITWSDDPVQQGIDERRTFLNKGYQTPQVDGESDYDYHVRTTPTDLG